MYQQLIYKIYDFQEKNIYSDLISSLDKYIKKRSKDNLSKNYIEFYPVY